MLKNDARFDHPGVKRILKVIPDQQIDRYIEQWGKRSKLRNF